MESIIERKLSLVERLEKLGWLSLPTAKEHFSKNSSLIFKFKEYELYLESNYPILRGKWAGQGHVVNVSSKVNLENSDKEIETSFTYDSEQVEEINNYIELINKVEEESKLEQPKEQTTEVKPNIKFKNKEVKNNYRVRVNTCPDCGSKLITNEVNTLECSGDKLQDWIKEFIKYESFDEEKRNLYKKKYSDFDRFLELFNKWLNNNRILECEYSNKIGNPISKIRTSIYDPILVTQIEKSLGRKLTGEELNGEVELWRERNGYFTDYKKGRQRVRIPLLVYPDNFL